MENFEKEVKNMCRTTDTPRVCYEIRGGSQDMYSIIIDCPLYEKHKPGNQRKKVKSVQKDNCRYT